MKSVFISHSTKDDKVVAEIRGALQGRLVVWDDSQYLAGGDSLGRTVERVIDESDYFIALLSLNALNSPWVRKEIRRAQKGGQRIVPVMLAGIEAGALGWFGDEDEPVGVKFTTLAESLPALEAALELRLPGGDLAPVEVPAVPTSDLVLELTDPAIQTADGKRRATATALLRFHPHDGGRAIESQRYRVTAPLGPIENEELAWYLERFINWPTGIFLDRARRVEERLPEWGRSLYEMLNAGVARKALERWTAAPAGVEPRFTIKVDKNLAEGSPADRQKEADEAATMLLALPWELIHDGHEFLAQAARGVSIRRSLPNRDAAPPMATDPPIRVLLVSPRPADQGYIDHRASALPLVEALSGLGDLAEFKLLHPPTFEALQEELERQRYHVVHFDGHGVYDPRLGLGALCFEDAQRKTDRVNADQIAELVKDRRVPLFFLDACQTAVAGEDPSSSVAGKLLECGVASVAAMSHTVLVETARRFVAAFYQELVRGKRAGEAMLAGQQALARDTFRGKVFTGELRLQDWFVPVLFQEEQDPQLIRALPADKVRAVIANRQEIAYGNVPRPPDHGFVGRSRELLEAERTLAGQRYIVLQGEGGEGKTALAAELARWLVLARRFHCGAFVALDRIADRHGVLFEIAGQLVPGVHSKAGTADAEALRLVKGTLAQQTTVIVLDNMESILPPALAPMEEILELARELGATGETRLIFTSRQPLPEPFASNVLPTGRLERSEAIRLVGQVLGKDNLMPHAAGTVESEREIESLVDAVACHARALVLLVREVVASGVAGATGKLHELMRSLEAKHPGERERSLLASVELSLRRLKPETRRVIRPLGVYQGGVYMGALAAALKLEQEQSFAVGRELVGVGLAEELQFGYLRFDPALAPALLDSMTAEERETAREGWAATMAAMAVYLYEQQFKDSNLANNLALLEVPNLVAALEHIPGSEPPERVVELATRLEALISRLNRPEALARVVQARISASQQLGEWSHARFEAEVMAVERLIDQGRHGEAVHAARSLLERAGAGGENAYHGADHDLAGGSFVLGRALTCSGSAREAIPYLNEAQRQFQKLGEGRMSDVALGYKADCLRDLGRYDEAAESWEETAQHAAGRNDVHMVAGSKSQLATVRRLQKKYNEALAGYSHAVGLFSRSGDHRMVAMVWHEIGMVYEETNHLKGAETAYQNALKIEVQIGDRAREATTLGQLGILYSKIDRREDAVRLHRQAADVFVAMTDLKHEGTARNNAAAVLVQLRRYDEARAEVLRAIECKRPFGHAAQPWTTFHILSDLERALGNVPEGCRARSQAIESYLAYRRDGGASQTNRSQLFALAATEPEAARSLLAQLSQRPNLPAFLQALLPALEAVLAGSRDPALADDPSLHYADAVELLLLIETLSRPG